jgi:hypothetical protein
MTASENVVAARLLRGSSSRLELSFCRGTDARLVSVGQQGSWQVSAPGVESIHAFLYFDGRDFWVLSAQPEAPPTLDGRALGEAWMQAVAPAVLGMGEAQIAFEAFAMNDPRARLAAPAGRPETADATRIATADDARLLQPRPPIADAKSPRRKSRRGPRARKGLMLAVVVLLGLGVLLARFGPHGIRRARRAVETARGRLASGSAALSAKPPVASPPKPTVPTSSASATPLSPESGGQDALDRDAVEEGDDSSLERRAADALASGDAPTALDRYNDLATVHPDRPVFREAARILAAKRKK